MSRGRLERGSLIFAVALGARAAGAAGALVIVSCPELSGEDTAQVEARVRASLLTAGLEPATVELSCEADSARTQVTGNGRQVMQRAERNASSVKEALLASADGALAAWGAPPVSLAGAAAALPASPAPAPALANLASPASTPVLAAPPAPSKGVPTARPAVRSSRALTSTSLSAGLRAELWGHAAGLGGQLGLQHELSSAFMAIQVGYLVAVPASSRFSAREVPLCALLGWQPPELRGLRGALGVGLSVFGATPATGVRAQSGTSSALPFLSVELSRPTPLGPFAFLPSLGVSAFSQARRVEVNQQDVIALPALTLEASLGLALKVGG